MIDEEHDNLVPDADNPGNETAKDTSASCQFLDGGDGSLRDAMLAARIACWEYHYLDKFFYGSDFFLEILSFSKKQKKISLSEFFKKIHPDDRGVFMEMLDVPFFETNCSSSEVRYMVNERYLWIRFLKGKQHGPKDGLLISSGIMQDISCVKDMEKEMTKAKEKAEESDRLKSAFLANMSHEIRTPLNGILGFVNMVVNRSYANEQELQKYKEIIANSAEQLMRVINDIIDISKIECGQLSVLEKEVSLNQVFEEIEVIAGNELAKIEKQDINIFIEKALNNGQDLVILDKSRLKQVLGNLLYNAIKYTEQGFIKLGYKIENENFLLFYVENSGTPIPEEKRASIFERFSQADEGLNRKHGGTGLGLAICKNIIALMGGEIWLDTEENSITKFLFKIPLITKNQDEISCSEIDDKEVLENKKKVLETKTILVVDDIEDTHIFFKGVFNILGIKSFHAYNGEEAVSIIKSEQEIDLVLMDIQMPGMDGYEATKRMKKERKNISVVAQSAHALKDDVQKALKMGFDGYITKPIDIEKLTGKLIALLAS